MLGASLIRHQVVQVGQPHEKRLLAAIGMMKAFHGHLTSGFDHGVGHFLLLLYDAKAPNYRKSKAFKGLGHYPSNTALSAV